MRAIFARNDPVNVGTRLLTGEADSTVGRSFGLFLEYLYGKPAQPYEARGALSDEIEYQLVSNVPRPHYPPAHYLPGAPAKNASGAAAPSTNVASRSNGPESSSD